MHSALKLGCKHLRQRQAQKKREKHTAFIPVGFTAAPPLSSFFSASKTWYPLPQNVRKSPFKMRESTPSRIWRIPPHFLFPHFFFLLLNFLFFPLLSPLLFSSFFCFSFSFINIRIYSILHTFSPGNSPNQSRTSQLHKHSSIHEVKSWPHLSLCLTTKNSKWTQGGLQATHKMAHNWAQTVPRNDLELMGLNQIGFRLQNQQKQCST